MNNWDRIKLLDRHTPRAPKLTSMHLRQRIINMGITVGCMATSMHVMPIGGDAPSSGPSQWTMTSSDGRRLSLTELKESIKVPGRRLSLTELKESIKVPTVDV